MKSKPKLLGKLGVLPGFVQRVGESVQRVGVSVQRVGESFVLIKIYLGNFEFL